MRLLTDQAAWRELEAYYAEIQHNPLKCTKRDALSVADLSLDYSRNHFDDNSIRLFSQLADAIDLSTAINRLMSGEIVNLSEQRAAWHTMLRDPEQQTEAVKACYEKMREYESLVRQRDITDIVHIGIGGSYLGPRFLYDAFASISAPKIRCHFIANQNAATLQKRLHALNPQKTLVIIVSKSFTTAETMANGKIVLAWLQKALAKNWPQQVMAVTANSTGATALSILPAHIFPLWDWVGGRFSLWSAVSLSLVLAFGWEIFSALLSGAHAMDQHFQCQAWDANMPVILAFIGLVYRHFFHAQTQAIIPYHNALTRLPSHLQQLHMESLGKQVTQTGHPINYPTGAIIWGGTGPGSQHSFHQLLLQGHDTVPVDFIVMQGDALAYQNCLAQAAALINGNRDEGVPIYERLSGNRPSSMIAMPHLTAESLGALLAMYEHKVFTQAMLWDINPFDQWGRGSRKKISDSLLIDKSASCDCEPQR